MCIMLTAFNMEPENYIDIVTPSPGDRDFLSRRSYVEVNCKYCEKVEIKSPLVNIENSSNVDECSSQRVLSVYTRQNNKKHLKMTQFVR